MAAICKACTNVEPELTLKFFVPHLCERIETILAERVNHKKSDHELQVRSDKYTLFWSLVLLFSYAPIPMESLIFFKK